MTQKGNVSVTNVPTQTSLWEVLWMLLSDGTPSVYSDSPDQALEGAIPACLEQCVGMRAESYSSDRMWSQSKLVHS